MYRSPIGIVYQKPYVEIEKKLDSGIYTVDKEELIRALKYDRDQYNKGYADGMADARAEIVRCKDCKHWKEADDGRSWQMIGRTDGACRWLAEQHYAERYMTEGEHFCSYGERRCDNEVD